MIRLSASLIKDILTCTQRGYYRVNLPEQSIETPEMALGTVVHSTLEQFWNNQEKATEFAKLESMRRELDPDKAIKMVSGYFKYFIDLVSEGDEIEKFFELKYSDDIIIVGKLDRVNPTHGFVVDWKTSANPPSNIDNDPQFILYEYAFTRLYGKEPELVAYASLTKGKLIKYNKNKFLYSNFFEGILPKVIEILRYSKFSKDGLFDYFSDKYKGTISCTFCPFKDACWNTLEEY